VPEAIPELIEAAGVIGGPQPMVLVKVRDIGYFGAQAPLCSGPGAARRLDFSELAGESELPIVIELLILENQHGVAVDRVPDRANRRRRERPAGINPGNRTDK